MRRFMDLFTYKEFSPQIHESAFVATGVRIIGRAKLGASTNVWFNSVIRADVNTITIGDNTNIQDLSILHVTEENSLTIGNNVTVGHSVILHACSIGDGSLIGMGAKVLDGTKIGKRCLVAAGSVVPPGKDFPDESFIMGAPAKVIRQLDPREIEIYSNHYKSYVGYAQEYKQTDIVKKIN